jgi:hypothetical protein
MERFRFGARVVVEALEAVKRSETGAIKLSAGAKGTVGWKVGAGAKVAA